MAGLRWQEMSAQGVHAKEQGLKLILERAAFWIFFEKIDMMKTIL